ncbi:MAG: cobalamin-dependent protein [Caldilineaceae bacterium]
MRVVLINPKFRLPIDTRTTPHLGLAYLAAVSEARGDEVVIFDADVEKQPVTEFIQEFRPHLVGITANTPQVKQAWRTARAIKEVHDCPIVLGGPHVSVLPEESCEKPYVDIVVRSEGEEAWIDISNRLEAYLKDQPGFRGCVHASRERDLRRLPRHHLSHQRRADPQQPGSGADCRPGLAAVARVPSLQDGELHQLAARHRPRGRRAQLQHFDQPWLSLSLHLLQPEHHAHQVAQPGPESVLAEWRHLVEDLGAEEIGILDDSANIRVKRLEELATLLIENDLNHVPWIFVNGIRANLASKELLALLKAAGLKRTAFGVESGDPEILKSIDKKVDHDTIRWAFQNAKDVGLETIAFLIIGLPGETRETMQRTIDFAIELDPLIANFSMMTPYPGTKVYEIIKRQGRFLINDWEDYVFFEQKARYEMGEMTAELVEEMYRKAYRQYYLRPAPVMRRVKTKDFWLNLPRNVRIASRTFLPKKEKAGLRKAVEAEGAI